MTDEELLSKLEKAIKSCKKCRLYKNATNAVPGYGNSKTKIVFVGEAPGFNEDKQGLPFVGRAGKLLDSMLVTIKLDRSSVWIGNIIKHRPPENRDPMKDEVRQCSGFLEEQLRVIKPSLIVTLGRIALEYFVKEAKISEYHGVPISYKGRMFFPLYHPAAALRNGNIERILKEDFKKLSKAIKGELEFVELGKENLKEKGERQISFI
ncbi:MAG: uracil-DNA glycosylase [bacterium]